MTADEVAEVHGHQAVCDELRKYIHVGRRPLSNVSPEVDISFHRPNVKWAGAVMNWKGEQERETGAT